MAKKAKSSGCGPDTCSPEGMGCMVEAIVSIDDRGQMVLPKDVREKAGIKPGDKLTVASCGRDGNVHMIVLLRSEDFGGMVSDFIGPAMGNTKK